MANDKDPGYYEKKLADHPSDIEVQEMLLDIERILKGMDKGFALLKEMGKDPDDSVLKNQKRFQNLVKKLKANK